MKQTNFVGFDSLVPRKITSVESTLGYMQVLEYTLQDFSYLHVVQWNNNNNMQEDGILPIVNNKTFFKDKNNALKFANEIGHQLLEQYVL